MNFEGLDGADLANVRSLNRAFLDAQEGVSARRDGATARIASRIGTLDGERRSRLARCPFLLFSLTRNCEPGWHALFVGERAPGLLRALEPVDDRLSRLATAAVGFLWQLARRNIYAARLVSGATISWCENMAEATLVDLFEFADREPALISAMRAGDQKFWDKLLDAGTRDDPGVRRAARLSALQMILTASATERMQRLPSAACSFPAPVSVSSPRGYNTRPDESADHQKPQEDL
ncbi:MAG: hypothetical protein ACE5F8_00305 [Woeseiaceae bacterium]